MSAPASIVLVGSGFAGWHATRTLLRRAPPGTRLTLVSPIDYLLYTPLLPAVATGVIAARSLAVPLGSSLRGVERVLGVAREVDVDARTLAVQDAAGSARTLHYDALILAPGSVTKQLPVPGLTRFGFGLKTLTQAQELRDHVYRQLDLASSAGSADERRARSTFVVVGAGYAGTELVAQFKGVVDATLPRWPGLRPQDIRFLLVDAADRVMPELGDKLGQAALALLRRRGVEVQLQTTVQDVERGQVTLSSGEQVPTRTLVWCAGVEPGPLVATLDLPLEKGRLQVDAQLRVDGRSDVWAVGDAAAVPDLTRSGEICPPTAQHAQRQGTRVARNVAAALWGAPPEPYEHRDLGLLVDLGRDDSVARPLGVPLTGLAAKAVTLGYHVLAMPTLAGRARLAGDLLLAAVTPTQAVQLRELPDGRGTLPEPP